MQVAKPKLERASHNLAKYHTKKVVDNRSSKKFDYSSSNLLESTAIDSKKTESRTSSKMNPWSDELDNAIANFPKLEKDQEGYCGFDKSSQTVKITKAFLSKLYRHDIKVPHIAPHDEGSILFEWFYPSTEIMVSISPAGVFEYCLANIGKADKLEYVDYETKNVNVCLEDMKKWFSKISLKS